jgi:hypothetical protein
MKAIAKKSCRAMFEPPGKGERVTPDPNLSARLNLLFCDHAVQPKHLKIVQQDQAREPKPGKPRRIDTLSNGFSDVRFGCAP